MQYNTVLTSEHLGDCTTRAEWETHIRSSTLKNYKATASDKHVCIDHFADCDGHPAAETLVRDTFAAMEPGTILSILFHWKLYGPNYRNGPDLLWDWRTVQAHMLAFVDGELLDDQFWRWPSEDILTQPALLTQDGDYWYTSAHLAIRKPKA